MKQRFTLLLMACMLFSITMFAQTDPPTGIDTIPPPPPPVIENVTVTGIGKGKKIEVPSNISSELITVLEEAKEMGLDDKVNAKVKPVTDFVESVVFFAIDIMSTTDFYKMPTDSTTLYEPDSPYGFSFDTKSTIPYGTEYIITGVDASRYLLTNTFTNDKGQSCAKTNIYSYGKESTILLEKAEEEGEEDKEFKFTIAAPSGGDANTVYKFGINKISLPIVLIVLVLGALFFTLYFKFINITGFRLAINTVRGKYSNPDEIGEVSHFQALTAALSATVGLGNIAGVAIAIAIGGPGATFWMIIAGFLGMASKFAECTLGVHYREVGPDGTVYGGPMYYLSKGLKEKGYTKIGKFLAVFFAIMCVGGSFGGGNMFQANQAAAQVINLFEIEAGYAGILFGSVLAVLVAIVIIGGIKRIGSVTEKVVPFMCGIYVFAALIIILANVTKVPEAFGLIFAGAFAPTAVAGGVIGVLVQGFRRAAFSNEAGVGSAAIAHSAVKTKYAASEGIVALLEPFIDTVVVCTMTALVIVITGSYVNPEGLNGVDLTSSAFATVFPWFPYVLTIAVVLFAFSTMLSWSYYGLQSWMYLFGRSKIADYTYKILFCIFIVLGSAASLGAVVGFSDAMIFAMVFPNIIGLVILGPVIKEQLAEYLAHIRTIEGK